MPLSSVGLLFMAMLLAALLLEPAARRLRLPLSAALVDGAIDRLRRCIVLPVHTGTRH